MANVARLLEHIIPDHYALSVDIDMDQFRYRGLEEMAFELTKASHELTLHASDLDVTLAELDSKHKAVKTTFDKEAQTVTFEFAEEIPAGDHSLSVAFAGTMGDELHGFYRSQYSHDGAQKWLVTTDLEATHAREVFVCIDEPSAKAVFEITLMIPDTLTVISNTNPVSEAPAGSGRKKVQFAPSPKMSTYLVYFMAGELEHIEGVTPEGVTVRVNATPGHTGQLAFALDVAIKSLSFYTEYFGIPYPLPKLDMIAIPDFAAGAMENWGAVTYREAALLLDPAKTSLINRQRVAEVVLHELAHQWFGNLVTMAWWDDLWLNEGFASWMEVFTKDHIFPDWQVWTEFVSSDWAYSMELDGLANTHPIQSDVLDPRHLDEIFDAVAYNKGSSIINMLHHYLGGDSFRAGLQDYLKAHSYGNATTHDLWKAFEKASGKPVDAIMSVWTKQAGYPLVSFDDGNVEQRRFYSSPIEAAKAKLEAAAPWPIPFSVALPSGKESKPELFETVSAPLGDDAMGSEWFKPNPGQTGFYRTHYTQGMIDALDKPLQELKLGAVDRFGIVNDVLATTQAGITGSDTALKLVGKLRHETDYIVWGGISGSFGELTAVVEDEPLRQQLDRFGHWLVTPNVERLGWETKPDESVFDGLMRPIVLQQAVRFDDEAVTKEARKRFKAYLEGAQLEPSLRPVVLYAAARHGGTDEFDAMVERYRAEQSPQVKMSLLGALGRFRKPTLTQRYLDWGLSEDVRPQDLYIVLAYGFRNRESRFQAWKWLKENWDLFIKRYGGGGHMIERFPLYAADGFASHKMADEIKEFFTTHMHPSIKRPTAQALEGLILRADWYDRDKLKIQTFMDQWDASQK